MSFVLDALKVSEQRRSRFARPVYAHPPRPHPRRRRRRWLAALATMGGVTAVILAWQLLIPAPTLPSVERPGGVDTAAGKAANQVPGDLPAGDIGNRRQAESGAPAGQPQIPDRIRLSGDGQSPDAARTRPVPPALPGEEPDEVILNAAPPDWPALELQMLFHSPQDDRSFVQINGRSYRKGERLDDGPELIAIGPDGVVLAYRNARVRLAMQR